MRSEQVDLEAQRRIGRGDPLLVGLDELERPFDHEDREPVGQRPHDAKEIEDHWVPGRHEPGDGVEQRGA